LLISLIFLSLGNPKEITTQKVSEKSYLHEDSIRPVTIITTQRLESSNIFNSSDSILMSHIDSTLQILTNEIQSLNKITKERIQKEAIKDSNKGIKRKVIIYTLLISLISAVIIPNIFFPKSGKEIKIYCFLIGWISVILMTYFVIISYV
jgi:hypothetical protein